MTTVWLHVGGYDPGPWRRALELLRTDLTILDGTDPARLQASEIAAVWAPPLAVLARLPRLRAILALSAGADGLLKDPELPQVPIARLVHASTQSYYRDYVVHAVLHHHRHMEQFRLAQAARQWRPVPPAPHERCPIAVLGLGALGLTAALALRDLGFPVRGWSRSARTVEGIACHGGPDGLAAVVSGARVLVCMLPATPATIGIVDRALLSLLSPGAHLINLGRGNHLDEDAVLDALRSGRISGATLDVMQSEPPDADHPFWSEPNIRITPHIAAIPDPDMAAEALSGNIDRVLRGALPEPLVDRQRGY
jgi:glyoxylate/hydroxypyruvate reductase A